MKEKDFHAGVIQMVESGLNMATEDGVRTVALGAIGYMDKKDRERVVKFHIICEPEVFSKTVYATDDGEDAMEVGNVADQEKRMRYQRSVTISQLKTLESETKALEAMNDAPDIRH